MTTRLRWLAAPEEAALRLVCFPYAGGDGGAYVPWQPALGPGIAVGLAELPGRGGAFSVPPFDRMEELVRHFLGPLRQAVPAPFALFGYSMGALLAYELAAALCAEAAAPRPLALFVAAHRAPGRQDRRPPMHALPREPFLQRLRELSGTRPEVLEHPELVELLMPRLRADFRVSETYRWTPRPPLPIPLFAFGGREDADVPAEDLAAWGAVAGGRFEWLLLEGGHFFIHTAPEALPRQVASRLAAFACANRRGAEMGPLGRVRR